VPLAATETSTTKAVGDVAALVDDGTGPLHGFTKRCLANEPRACSTAVAELGSKVAQSCGSVPERF
jgi:hypothetical protein